MITESKFKTFGCGSAIASSSVATEWLKGRSVDESLKIKNTDIAGHLKLPPVKLHCRRVQFRECGGSHERTRRPAMRLVLSCRVLVVKSNRLNESIFFLPIFEEVLSIQ